MLSKPARQEHPDCVKYGERLGLAVAVIGALVLIGWLFNVGWLKSLHPALVSMKANTALCFLLCGIALKLLSRPGSVRHGDTFARLCAAAAALIGALTLGEYLFGLELGIDQALFKEPAGAVNTFIPGRMAWSTALNFLLCGAAVALQDVPIGLRLSQLMATTAGAIGAFYVIAYFLGSIASSNLTQTPMAVHTSILFIFIAAGILLSKPGRGWVHLIAQPSGNDLLTRRLLPFCIATMMLIGWLRLAGQKAGLYDVGFGAAITVFSGIIVITALILRAAAALEGRNRERERLQAETAMANKELESFSYSVSHDLRAPLRSIDGFSQALLEDSQDKLDPQCRDYLNRIRKATQRMGELIDDILTLSRVTRIPMRHEPVDLSLLAETVAKELRAQNPSRSVQFSAADRIRGEGDLRLLRIVLENLIGNAWKYTAGTPEAEVGFGAVLQPDGARSFFVRDNGAGFDMAYAGKLFGAFQRLHTATEFPGNGIGLATVARIVRLHGGKAWAEGAVGKGASFYFTLGSVTK